MPSTPPYELDGRLSRRWRQVEKLVRAGTIKPEAALEKALDKDSFARLLGLTQPRA